MNNHEIPGFPVLLVVAESTNLVQWTNPRLAMGFGPANEFDHGGCVIGALPARAYRSQGSVGCSVDLRNGWTGAFGEIEDGVKARSTNWPSGVIQG
jgi:hypothetical protein